MRTERFHLSVQVSENKIKKVRAKYLTRPRDIEIIALRGGSECKAESGSSDRPVRYRKDTEHADKDVEHGERGKGEGPRLGEHGRRKRSKLESAGDG